jgi:hypothetical protein
MEAHQKKSKILQFFRQGEMNTLLKACHLGLEQALEVFKVCSMWLLAVQQTTIMQVQNVFSSSDVIQMQQYAQKEHQEILDLISCLSDETYSDTTSTVCTISLRSDPNK